MKKNIATKNIVIIGAGFAGMWAALSAARLAKLQANENLNITVLAPKAELRVRPRFYESKVRTLVSPLMPVFETMGVRFITATVENIQTDNKQVQFMNENGEAETVSYDKLVLASGSNLNTNIVKGINEYTFNLDQLDTATLLDDHISNLHNQPF